jgi:hypothetical protein
MTTCVPSDRIMQTLRVHVPGATDKLIELELFNTIDEFLRRTTAWRYTTDVDLEEDKIEYGFAIPPDSQVVRAISVTHQGTAVPSSTQGGITQLALGRLEPELSFPDGDARFTPRSSDLVGQIFSYAIYRPEYISVSKPPDVEMRKYPLSIILALTISQGCLECDCGDWALEEWMYDTFFQDWLDGSLSRLYGMPSKPWTSNTHAVHHGKKFRNSMAFRKQEANRGFGYGIPGWRFPREGWVS